MMETIDNNCCCPLLQPGATYLPDTINLSEDLDARKYWLDCLGELTKRFVHKASYLHPGDLTAVNRAEKCRNMYLQVLDSLKENPSLVSPEPLSIRSLLEMNERCLRENGFTDPWLLQKNIETNTALEQFADRLKQIDELELYHERWTSLIEGLLAGNVFDWGAQAVSDILEKPQKFELDQALLQIESRPWLVDHLDIWLNRLQDKPHKCGVIFVDNAGIDFVLGILPTVREFLRQQTDIYLCANSLPSLNDVTIYDLKSTVCSAANYCPIISDALKKGRLKCFENGQSGPCLDLRHLHQDLCSAMSNVDLVIFEGMGRALHTNLNVKLSVDCLKLAVIKNEWLANRLGGKKFSVLCQFEPKS